jgi:excisionase family DNA binding protein
MEIKNLGERSSYELRSLASQIRGIKHAMTAEELADFLRVSRLTILRRAKRGTIPSFRVGSCVRFDPANISKWLIDMGVKSMSKP